MKTPHAETIWNSDNTGQTLLTLLWRRRLVFLGAFAAIYGIVLAALILLPKTYVATGSVIVAEPETGLGGQAGDRSLTVGDPADVESQLLVIRSDRVLKLVAATPGVIETIREDCAGSASLSKKCARLMPDSDDTLEYLSKHYSIAGVGRSRVIDIGYKSATPQIARDMANTLITAYLAEHRDSLISGKNVAALEIQRQLDQLDHDIRALDSNIEDFRRKNGLVRGSLAPINTELLSSLTQQLATAQSDKSHAESVLREVQSDLNRDMPTSPSVLANPAVNAIHTRMLAMSVQVDAASSSLGPRHPQYLALSSELSSLKSKLKKEVVNSINGVKKQLATAEDRVKNLQALVKDAETSVSKANADESSIAPLVRGVEVKRKEYADLSNKLKSLETEQQSTLGSTRLVSMASLPLTPVFPKTLPFLVGGIMLAAIGAGAAAFSVDWISSARAGGTGNRSTDRVSDGLDEHSSDKIDRAIPPVWQFGSMLALEEPLRPAQKAYLSDVLNRLDNKVGARPAGTAKSLMIAPLVAQPHNSGLILALHLARLSASYGMRTLLVEVAFEQPRLAAVLGLKPAYWLNDLLKQDILADQDSLYDIAMPVHGFDVVCSAPATGGVRLDKRLSDILELTDGYDLVVFACPGFTGNTTTGLVGRKADGVLFCNDKAGEDASLPLEVVDRLERMNLHVIGTFLMEKRNFVKVKNAAPDFSDKINERLASWPGRVTNGRISS